MILDQSATAAFQQLATAVGFDAWTWSGQSAPVVLVFRTLAADTYVDGAITAQTLVDGAVTGDTLVDGAVAAQTEPN